MNQSVNAELLLFNIDINSLEADDGIRRGV